MTTPAYEHNGQPVSRAGFYALACDPRRSVAVQACAGAGKTWMLVSRILRALIEPDASGRTAQPHEILAITFTRKAAGEMRQRLHEWLQDFARRPAHELARELALRGLPPEQAQELAPALAGARARLLRAARPVQVRTFHSWFISLLGAAPLKLLQELRLPAPYEILDEAAEAAAQPLLWRRWLRQLAQAAPGSHEADLREHYCALVRQHGRSQAHAALQTALDKRAEFSLADRHNVLTLALRHFHDQYPDLAHCEKPEDAPWDSAPLNELLWQSARAMCGWSAYKDKGPQLQAALQQRQFSAICDALLTQAGKPRAFGDKHQDVQTVRLAQEAMQRVLAALAQHQGWLHHHRLTLLARSLLAAWADFKRERGWIDMIDAEQAAHRMLTDPELSGHVQEKLDMRVRHLLIDEFQDTSPLQWQALHGWLSGYAGAGSGPGMSVFIVGDPKQSIYRFRRAEPQVFAAAQDFVRQGLQGDLLACDHTRRCALAIIEAANSALLAAQAEGDYADYRTHTSESAQPGSVLALPEARRPEAAGQTHSTASPAENQPESPSEGQSATDSETNSASGIEWRNSLTTPRETPEDSLRQIECRQAAAWLAARLAEGGSGNTPADFMVLARKNEALILMQQALLERGVPCEMIERTPLGEMPVVQDILALLDALLSPAHELALARALKSPLFGLDDQALIALARAARDAQASGGRIGWFDLLQTRPLPAALAAHIPPKLGQELRIYQSWLASLPPHDALQAILDHRDACARYAAAAPAHQRQRTLAQIHALLHAALNLKGARFLTAWALVRELRKTQGSGSLPVSASGLAVRLLTIHSAKGLEANTVLLLDTQAAPPKAKTMSALIHWPGASPHPEQFIFLISESHPPPGARELLEQEKAEQRREELNALYVAITRAQERLVLSCSPARTKSATWRQRLQAVARPIEPEPEPASSQSAQSGEPASALPFHIHALPDWQPQPPLPPATLAAAQAAPLAQLIAPPPAPEALEPIEAPETPPAADDTPARIGQAMHWLLECAGRHRHADAPFDFTQPQRLQRAQRQYALSAEQTAHAARLAQTIHTGQAAWAWQKEHVIEAFDEASLLHEGQELRIDRLIRRRLPAGGHEWWVLDYKSALRPEKQPSYHAQLARYRQALQAIHPGQTIRCALLAADGRMVEI